MEHKDYPDYLELLNKNYTEEELFDIEHDVSECFSLPSNKTKIDKIDGGLYKIVVTWQDRDFVDSFLKIKHTTRGFEYVEFKDSYDQDCSISKSSSAEGDFIWVGQNDKRMLLSREQVQTLLPTLLRFVNTGDL
jgi:hypothetical protein